MRKARRSRGPCRQGFTAGGLVLAIAAAALILAVLIPLYLRAKDWATDRSTMADMRMVERAILRYIEAAGKAPTSPNGVVQYQKPFFRELLPYLDFVRPVDWWGYNYWIWTWSGGPRIRDHDVRPERLPHRLHGNAGAAANPGPMIPSAPKRASSGPARPRISTRTWCCGTGGSSGPRKDERAHRMIPDYPLFVKEGSRGDLSIRI